MNPSPTTRTNDRELMRRALGVSILFANWPAASIGRLLEVASLRDYAAGEAIAFGARRLREVIVVVSGYVELSNVSPDGRRHVLPLIGAGQISGLLRLLDLPVAAMDVRAQEATRLIHVPCDALRALLDQEPILWRDVAMVALTRHRASARARHHLAVSDPLRRLASTLVELLARRGLRATADAPPPITVTQTELANMVGVSRETVRKALDHMEKDGMVGCGYRCIRVLDADRLRRLAQ